MVGNQNLGKSSAIKALCPSPELFTDDVGQDVGARDTKMSLASVWLIEFAEGEQLAKETKVLKAFLSRQIDRFRLPYARLLINKKRQSLFIVTANELELSDETGNRRYWPIEIAGPIDVEAIKRDRDQIWAEAAELYRRGEVWWLNAATETIAAEQQARYELDPDPLLDEIRPWVEQQTDFFVIGNLLKDALKLSVTDARAVNMQHRVAKLLMRELGCGRVRPKSGPMRDVRGWRRVRV
jgi:predicted P-loop ATPase